ncbi:MAG: hypothetical protein ACR2RL_01125, partial [Gammaproteobacteria bacterium]
MNGVTTDARADNNHGAGESNEHGRPTADADGFAQHGNGEQGNEQRTGEADGGGHRQVHEAQYGELE